MQRANLIRERRYRAEREFPIRLTVRIPPYGFGQSLNDMLRWLDSEVGKGRYEYLPAGQRHLDAIHIFLLDLPTAKAFLEATGVGIVADPREMRQKLEKRID